VSGSRSTPPPLLVGLQLAGASVLVVGGGPVATRRATRLVEAGAHLTVVAPQATDQLAALAPVWHRREYRAGDVDGMVLVVTATGDAAVDAQVVADGRAAGAWVNHAGDGAAGDLIVPAVAARGNVSIAVTTGGQSPSLARWLAADLGEHLLPVVDEAARLMGAVRRELGEDDRAVAHDRWAAALDDGLLDLVRRGELDHAAAMLRRHLGIGEEGEGSG
jgi:precorrin-2 dehydrogenase / sirohydrochlorin ferrochelatase